MERESVWEEGELGYVSKCVLEYATACKCRGMSE